MSLEMRFLTAALMAACRVSHSLVQLIEHPYIASLFNTACVSVADCGSAYRELSRCKTMRRTCSARSAAISAAMPLGLFPY